MEKINKKTYSWIKRVLSLIAFISIANGIMAQINGVSTNIDPAVYVSNGVNEVVINVNFDAASLEYADFIEFVAPTGITLSSNFVPAQEYYNCGKNQGTLFPANYGANGIGWGRPGYSLGGSGCGAFDYTSPHSFRVKIEANAIISGPIELITNVYGHGYNGAVGFATTSTTLNETICALFCPDNIVIPSNPGTCSAEVQMIAVGSQACEMDPVVINGNFDLGTSTVEFVSNADSDDEVRCTRFVTVFDGENPYILNCEDLNVQLPVDECVTLVDFPLEFGDNCGNQSHSLLQPKLNDVDFSIKCQYGPTHYYRIYDFNSYGINNDFHLNNIEIGVFQSFNNPNIDINLYVLEGDFNESNMTLVGSTNLLLPDLYRSLFNIPVDFYLEGGSKMVVEIVTPYGDFGSILGFNNAPEFYPSYVKALGCGEFAPQLVENAFGGNTSGSLVLNIYGQEDGIKVTPNHLSGLMPGDEFGAGLYNLSYTVTDASNNSTECSFTLYVEGEELENAGLACNDTIYVSMEEQCYTEITPDMILEGNHYECYEQFEVIIYDVDGTPLGNTVGPEQVGQALDVDIYISEFDNRCSGTLIVEDNYPPVFSCETVTTSCASDLTPGAPLSSSLAYNIYPNVDIPSDLASVTEIPILVNGFRDALITDLNIILDISHTNASDLEVSLTSPDGSIFQLFSNPGNLVACTGSDLVLTIDEQAGNTSFALENLCLPESPSFTGSFQPVDGLGALNETSLNGEWTITVFDNNSTNGGHINHVTFAFNQYGGILDFPVPPGSVFTPNGTNAFIADGFDACGPVYLTYEDEVVSQDCSSPYSQVIYRNWIGSDENGNTSQCQQVIQVLNNGVAFLEFPPNYDDFDEDAFTCIYGEDYYPLPDITGMPFGDLCEEIEITYEDQRVDICPGTFKILRNWKVSDWCSGSIIEHVQIIKIADEEAPIIVTDLADIIVGTDEFACETDVDLPDPYANPTMILYDCRADEVTYEVAYRLKKADGSSPGENDPWVFDDRLVKIDHSDGSYHWQITDIPLDTTWIRYRFTDPCGNTSETFFEIIVEDWSNPVAVCDEHTQVSLGTNGQAIVDAINFDDGSHDNCTEVYFTARRMTPNCDEVFTFEEALLFCCEDIGSIQMVELKVTDAYGNFSTCMVEVEVIDKFPPLIICPEDITINCRQDYEDLDITGEPEVIDACGIDTIYYEDDVDIDQCGNGQIVRYWYATDINDLTSSCYQIITVIDNDIFSEDDIIWPKNITLFECESNTGPEITGDVIVNDDLCSLVAVTYKDQVFTIVDDACIKILRKWSVIDWCKYEHNNPDAGGFWEHTQVIKLMNTETPEFDEECIDLEFCSFGNCEGYIDFVKTAQDDCTPDELLRWTHYIDINNDGDFEIYDIHSNDASGTYPDGVHRIAWTVEDGCGNINTCEQIFTVKDCKKPTPLCYSQLTTVVMDITGMVEICAEDFDLCGNCGSGSYDNCTEQEDLIFTFSSELSDTCRVLDCDDIPNGESAFITLEIWVTDEAGNQDYCTVTLDLQDNEADVCVDIDVGSIAVSGSIYTPSFEAIEEVEVMIEDLNSNIGYPKFDYTDASGEYIFENLYSNHHYYVSPSHDVNHNEGVSTLDLIYIQRHLLGLSALNDPYQLIAADADNNEKLTASDLLTIRNLILGTKDEFPNNQESWRFVSSNHDFSNPVDPFPFVESINTHDYKDYLLDINFTGVKIGDVNNSYNGINGQNLEPRSNETMIIKIDGQDFIAGETLNFVVKAEDFGLYSGGQFTMEFNKDVLSFEALNSVSEIFKQNNFGFRYIDQGLITVSWNNQMIFEEDNTSLFELQFTAISNGKLSEQIRLSDRITKTETYNSELEVTGLDLRFSEDGIVTEAREYSLHQNIPNPFSESTEIYFELPEASHVSLLFYDLAGSLIYTISGEYNKGLNTVEIQKNTLKNNGVIYYQLKTDSFTQTRKMICIK